MTKFHGHVSAACATLFMRLPASVHSRYALRNLPLPLTLHLQPAICPAAAAYCTSRPPSIDCAGPSLNLQFTPSLATTLALRVEARRRACSSTFPPCQYDLPNKVLVHTKDTEPISGPLSPSPSPPSPQLTPPRPQCRPHPARPRGPPTRPSSPRPPTPRTRPPSRATTTVQSRLPPRHQHHCPRPRPVASRRRTSSAP